MGLRDEAADFVREILEDDEGGFGQAITFENPAGETAALKGFTTDIAATIDPNTGSVISNRKVTVTVSMAALADAGLGMPEGKESGYPWLVSFADLAGTVSKLKVKETIPDRTLGVVVCVLEGWLG